MCHPRRDEPELIPRKEYIEPLSDESDSDDEEMPETDDESEDTEDTSIEESEETDDESVDTEDTFIEESDETDDESEDTDVTSSEESHVPEVSSSDENFNFEEVARGRRLGHVSARRARHAQYLRNELSPSLSGVTFNGFTQNLVPEEIIGHRIVSPIEMQLSVRWRNHPEIRLIELSVMREHRPDMVVDYLRAMVARLQDNNFPSVYQNE